MVRGPGGEPLIPGLWPYVERCGARTLVVHGGESSLFRARVRRRMTELSPTSVSRRGGSRASRPLRPTGRVRLRRAGIPRRPSMTTEPVETLLLSYRDGEAGGEGRRLVGVDVPRELIEAAGFLPRRLRATAPPSTLAERSSARASIRPPGGSSPLCWTRLWKRADDCSCSATTRTARSVSTRRCEPSAESATAPRCRSCTSSTCSTFRPRPPRSTTWSGCASCSRPSSIAPDTRSPKSICGGQSRRRTRAGGSSSGSRRSDVPRLRCSGAPMPWRSSEPGRRFRPGASTSSSEPCSRTRPRSSPGRGRACTSPAAAITPRSSTARSRSAARSSSARITTGARRSRTDSSTRPAPARSARGAVSPRLGARTPAQRRRAGGVRCRRGRGARADVVLAWIRAGDDALAWDVPAQRRSLDARGIPFVVLDRRGAGRVGRRAGGRGPAERDRLEAVASSRRALRTNGRGSHELHERVRGGEPLVAGRRRRPARDPARLRHAVRRQPVVGVDLLGQAARTALPRAARGSAATPTTSSSTARSRSARRSRTTPEQAPWGGLPRRERVRDAGLDGRAPRRSRRPGRASGASRSSRFEKAVDHGAAGALVGAHRTRLGGGRRAAPGST